MAGSRGDGMPAQGPRSAGVPEKRLETWESLPRTRHSVSMAVMGGEIEFEPYERHQGSLFPAHLSEALDPGDPVVLISDWLDSTDVAVFEQRPAVLGERAYPQPARSATSPRVGRPGLARPGLAVGPPPTGPGGSTISAIARSAR